MQIPEQAGAPPLSKRLLYVAKRRTRMEKVSIFIPRIYKNTLLMIIQIFKHDESERKLHSKQVYSQTLKMNSQGTSSYERLYLLNVFMCC